MYIGIYTHTYIHLYIYNVHIYVLTNISLVNITVIEQKRLIMTKKVKHFLRDRLFLEVIGAPQHEKFLHIQ